MLAITTKITNFSKMKEQHLNFDLGSPPLEHDQHFSELLKYH